MKDAKKWASGFTIVELIVVIVVIGILAALVMVSYTAVVNNAHLQQVNGDAETAASTLFRYKADNGAYPSNLSSVTINNTQSTYQYSFNATNDTYCLTATYGNLSVYVQNGTNTPTPGACPGHGVNGVAPITNLMTMPIATSSYYYGAGTGGAATPTTVADARFPGGTAYKLTWSTAPTNSGSLWAGPPISTSILCNTASRYFVSIRYAASWSGASPLLYLSTSNESAPMTVINRGDGTFEARSSYAPGAGCTSNFGPVLTLTGASSLPTPGSTLLVGGFMVVAAPNATTTYNYADGNSNNWVWNGSSNASTSTGPQ